MTFRIVNRNSKHTHTQFGHVRVYSYIDDRSHDVYSVQCLGIKYESSTEPKQEMKRTLITTHADATIQKNTHTFRYTSQCVVLDYSSCAMRSHYVFTVKVTVGELLSSVYIWAHFVMNLIFEYTQKKNGINLKNQISNDFMLTLIAKINVLFVKRYI